MAGAGVVVAQVGGDHQIHLQRIPDFNAVERRFDALLHQQGAMGLGEAVAGDDVAVSEVNEQLLAQREALKFRHDVKVDGQGVGSAVVVLGAQAVVRADAHPLHGVRIELQCVAFGVAAEKAEAGPVGGEHIQPVVGAHRRDFRLAYAAAAVRVEIHQRRAGEVKAVVDQGLIDAVPAADFRAAPALVLVAHLDPDVVPHVHHERALGHELAVARVVVVVAVGVLPKHKGVVAGGLAKQRHRTAPFGLDAEPVPRCGTHRDLPGRRFDEPPFVGPGRLRHHVQVAGNGSWPVDGRGRAAHDVHPVGRADQGFPAPGTGQPPDAPKMGVGDAAAQVDARRQPEERCREGTRGNVGEVGDPLNPVQREHVRAQGGGGPRRFMQ